MKKLLLLCLLFPMIATGQDTYNLQAVLEKSMYAMDVKCKSIQYELYNTTSYSEGCSKYRIKALYDSVFHVNKLLVERSYYKSNRHDEKSDNRIVSYLDTNSQIAYQWNEKLEILTLKLFNGYWDDIYFMAFTNDYFSYIRKELSYLVNPIMQEVAVCESNMVMERLTDSSLLCKGLVYIHSKPHYVVEHIMLHTRASYDETYRYPDYKLNYYSPRLYYRYYYIDTITYVVDKAVDFSLTTDNDTIYYNNVDLIDYSINSFTDLIFNPDDYKTNKIIKETKPTEAPCDKGGYIVKDLSGKLPNISGLDINDKAFSLYKQKAKCYVLDFMYAKCGICIKSALPFWDEMSAKYNSRNIQYLIVDPVDDLRTVTYMAQQYNIKMPIIRDKEAQKKYAIDGYPTCYILDKNFNILFSTTGEITPCERKEIEKILSSYQK